MSCKDNKDGSCSVEYIPFTPGEYDVNITFGGRPIPGTVMCLLPLHIFVACHLYEHTDGTIWT